MTSQLGREKPSPGDGGGKHEQAEVNLAWKESMKYFFSDPVPDIFYHSLLQSLLGQ